nr:hypothetical protein PJ912_20415 [Pectobacterium colocasium]
MVMLLCMLFSTSGCASMRQTAILKTRSRPTGRTTKARFLPYWRTMQTFASSSGLLACLPHSVCCWKNCRAPRQRKSTHSSPRSRREKP